MYFRYKALLLKKGRIILKIEKKIKIMKILLLCRVEGGGERGRGLYIHVTSILLLTSLFSLSDFLPPPPHKWKDQLLDLIFIYKYQKYLLQEKVGPHCDAIYVPVNFLQVL